MANSIAETLAVANSMAETLAALNGRQIIAATSTTPVRRVVTPATASKPVVAESTETADQKIRRLEAENAALRAAKGAQPKVACHLGPSGTVVVSGIPGADRKGVWMHSEGWKTLRDNIDAIIGFADDNAKEIATRRAAKAANK